MGKGRCVAGLGLPKGSFAWALAEPPCCLPSAGLGLFGTGRGHLCACVMWSGLWNHDELILWKTIPCEMVLLLLLFWIFAHDLGVRFSPPLEERSAARRHYLECACSCISWLKVWSCCLLWVGRPKGRWSQPHT